MASPYDAAMRGGRRADIVWHAAIVALAVAAGAVAAGISSSTVVSLGLLVWTGCVLLVIRRRLLPALLSPVKVVAISYLGLAALGALLYERVARVPGGASIILHLSQDVQHGTVRLLIVATASFVGGAAVVPLLASPHPRAVELRPVTERSRRLGLLLIGAVIPLLLVVADVGLRDLISRHVYLPAPNGALPLVGIGSQLAVIAVLILG